MASLTVGGGAHGPGWVLKIVSRTISRDCTDLRKVHTQLLCALGGPSQSFRRGRENEALDRRKDDLNLKRQRLGVSQYIKVHNLRSSPFWGKDDFFSGVQESETLGQQQSTSEESIGTKNGYFEGSPVPRTRRTSSYSVPDDVTFSSYNACDDEIDFPMEASRMRALNIEDQWREREIEYCQAGEKRRSSSPPSDDIPFAGDGLRRREGGVMSWRPPTPRLTVIPQSFTSSMSSVSRNCSYVSNQAASSITSMGSFGRRSPNGLSPGGLPPTDPSRPYSVSLSATTSPKSALFRSIAVQSPHQRTRSEQAMIGQARRPLVSPRKLAEIPKNPSCPKKPKKLETEEELKSWTQSWDKYPSLKRALFITNPSFKLCTTSTFDGFYRHECPESLLSNFMVHQLGTS
ncbi:hypothetical protein B0H67DRAFT_558282 [Lasiosphaeris hirsuta]|uniref:Uncharacterized protein n=1 Tax=Lasiosphaeris hirsuta TaxID=260670 RepID=A0AA39ZS75_9PEZI|nr:hypothetical protein B0H67DRAFT_558282 [Lasiosphaeris hirsuta]